MPRTYELRVYEYHELSPKAKEVALQSIIQNIAQDARSEAAQKVQDAALKICSIPFGMHHVVNVGIASDKHFILQWRFNHMELSVFAKHFGLTIQSQALFDATYEYRSPGPMKAEYYARTNKIDALRPILDEKFGQLVKIAEEVQQRYFVGLDSLGSAYSYLEDGTIFLGLEAIYKAWFNSNPTYLMRTCKS